MKKRLLMIVVGIFIMLLLFSIPSNFIGQSNQTNSIEFAGVPPVKMPDKVPPKE